MSIAGVAFGQRNSSGTAVSATRTFAAGAYGLVLAAEDTNLNPSITFSGAGLTYNEIAAVDVSNGGDFFGQEAAWFQFPAGGSLTVTSTTGATTSWAGIALIEFAGVSGFDLASYLRTTSSPNCGSATNTNAAATRVAIGISWGGGTLANVSGYTDEGSGADFGGTNTMRVSSLVESSSQARTSAFAVGTGVSPFHCSQFIFNDTGGGGTVFTETLSSAIALADETPRFMVRGSVLTDLLSLLDSFTATVVGQNTINTVTLTSNIVVSEGSTENYTVYGMVAESVIDLFSEIIGNVVMGRVMQSTLGVSDSTSLFLQRNRLLQSLIDITEPALVSSIETRLIATDEVSISDQQLLFLLRHRLAGDDIGISDDYLATLIGQGIYTRILTSELLVSDSAVYGVARVRLIESSTVLNDSLQRAIHVVRDLISEIQLSDQPLTALQRFILLTDTVSIEDSKTATYVPYIQNIPNPVVVIGFDQPRIEIGGYGI